jgi:PKD repeat protein
MEMPKKILFCFLFALPLLFTGCGKDEAPTTVGGPPTVNGITPNNLARGLDHESATITGNNLNGVSAVDLGAGITIHSFSATGANTITLEISVGKNTDPGERTITVSTPLGTANASGLLSVRNNAAPSAVFTADPPAASTKIKVNFDASRSKDPNGNPLSYDWDFGDGHAAHGMKTSHQFDATGTFTVALTVSDNQESSNTTSVELEILSNAPPVAGFTVDPAEANDQNDVEFDASSKSYDPDGKVKAYLWDFGDGKKKETGPTVSRGFKQGTYTVSLTVTDNNGAESSTTRDLAVKHVTEIKCVRGPKTHGLIFGTLVGVDGKAAIVQFSKDRTCSNTFNKCDDLRNAQGSGVKEFFGIITDMWDLGNGKFRILQKCPINWPGQIGTRVFIINKTCARNFCP